MRPAPGSSRTPPDIYYIVFDEYAGFDALHDYWHDDYADAFQSFLKQDGFFVATGSRSRTLNTGAEIASRLNLQPYGEKLPASIKEDAINNSRVVRALEANGYTTVAIDMYFQNIDADINVLFDPESVGEALRSPEPKTFLDPPGMDDDRRAMFAQNPEGAHQRDLILYSLEKTVHPGKMDSPKFVYTHILLPHEPFVFAADGSLLPPALHDNWDAYLGQHKYATQLAERLVTRLLAQADPDNPPVIILQSDHGARNIPSVGKGGVLLNNLLKNYTLNYAHDILNALYLPGFNTRALPNDLDPSATFVVVLNHYLALDLAVSDTPARDWHGFYGPPVAAPE